MNIATGRSLTGRRISLTIFVVTFGFVQGRRQHSGGVPMGQVVACSTIVSTPPSSARVKLIKTSIADTETQSWRRETRGAVGGEMRAGRVRVMWRAGESWR